ncbi:MAG: phosphotransferase [Acidothermaceae bacterium]
MVDAATLPRALAAGIAVAAEAGLHVEAADVLTNSNRLTLRLRPCDVLARVAPRARRDGAEFDVEIARRLAVSGAPVETLDPRVEPRVYEHDDFVVTLWTYYETVPPHDIAPAEYACALGRLHDRMRQAGLMDSPHFTDRIEEARRLVDDATDHPWISGPDRALVAATLRQMRSTVIERGAPEQLLHGEPHPGNVLRSKDGLLFVDLETCCRGPVEFDIAHATISADRSPMEVAAHYTGADQSLVYACWILALAMVTAWRCDPADDLPNGRALAMDWIRQLRAAVH